MKIISVIWTRAFAVTFSGQKESGKEWFQTSKDMDGRRLVRRVVCNNCKNYENCKTDENRYHRMLNIEFWENAEKSCRRFDKKTAHWYINPDGYYPQCSNCNEEPESGLLEYTCPNCGAVMEGEAT